MYHSVYFGDKNSWTDWHLIPTTRPVILPPPMKTTTIDIPGADGVLDLSTALTGYPVYSNRTGSFEFIVENGHDYWYEIYSDIMDALHGKNVVLRLEDDMAYYYYGRVVVNTWNSDEHYSTITLDYDLDPYKYSVSTTCGDWIWDPFNFQNGIMIQSMFKEIPIDTNQFETLDIPMVYYGRHLYGRKPTVVSLTWEPTDENSPNLTVHFTNQELGIDKTVTYTTALDAHQEPEFIVSDLSRSNVIEWKVVGSGKLSIDYRLGRL